MADFWDALFLSAEEETAPDPGAEPESRPAMVKEPEERYGGRGEPFRRVPRRLRGGPGRGCPPVEGGAAAATDRRGAGLGGAGTAVVPVPSGAPPCLPRHPLRLQSSRRGNITSPRISSPGGSATSRSAGDSRQARRAPRPDRDRSPGRLRTAGGRCVRREDAAGDGRDVLAGRKVVLSKEGYERRSVPVDALSAGPAFRTELLPLIGTVEAIQAIPWAKVYLGNRLLGETPLTAVRLPAGEQRLRFVNEPLGVDQVKIVVVRPGDNPKIIVPMTGPVAGRT